MAHPRIAAERLFVNADKSKVVVEGDPEASVLLAAGPGDEIDEVVYADLDIPSKFLLSEKQAAKVAEADPDAVARAEAEAAAAEAAAQAAKDAEAQAAETEPAKPAAAKKTTAKKAAPKAANKQAAAAANK